MASETKSFLTVNTGEHPAIVEPVAIASGQDLTEGTLLGKEISSGKYKAFDEDAEDGTEIPLGILAFDCDATSGDKKASMYVHGVFNLAALTGVTDGAVLLLRQVGIYLSSQ